MGRLLAFLLLTSCGPDIGLTGRTVGGPCASNADCAAEARCLTDNDDFPGGTCSVSCGSHADCPEGTRCIDEDGGNCLLACDFPADCRGGYTCKGRTSRSPEGGDSLVCIAD